MFYRNILQSICLPIVAMTCTVCPAAADTNELDFKINELTGELAQRYFGTRHWPVLYEYLSKMHAEGNANVTDAYGNNLMEYCLLNIKDFDARMAHKILLCGLNANMTERSTNLTPLHRAAAANNYRMVLRLLAFGAERSVTDKIDRTPADMTTHQQLVDLLNGGHPAELLSKRAIAAWEKACQGDADAMWELAGYYNQHNWDDESGQDATYLSQWAKDERGADMDELEKIAWIEQAAALGHAKAQYDLGMRMVYGIHMPEDAIKGYALICAAENKGLESASEFLKENPAPPAEEEALIVPAELGDCTLTLEGRKKGRSKSTTYKMGYDAPMPKLKVFLWKPQDRIAEISFDGVGNAKAVHFNGTMLLTERKGNTYTFKVQGEMKGFDPKDFTATPERIIITINPTTYPES